MVCQARAMVCQASPSNKDYYKEYIKEYDEKLQGRGLRLCRESSFVLCFVVFVGGGASS
jgi:hypothetical protein